MAELVRLVPAYKLELGSDLGGLVGSVHEALARAATG